MTASIVGVIIRCTLNWGKLKKRTLSVQLLSDHAKLQKNKTKNSKAKVP